MTARLIDGKAAAQALRLEVAADVARFREATGRAPGSSFCDDCDHPA
jgi:methylenetetrahydrofolate dehydrogenase (NADP+)/methenyltetrahydrofolate cyclohydrolase